MVDFVKTSPAVVPLSCSLRVFIWKDEMKTKTSHRHTFDFVAGLSDPGGCGEKHSECGASGIPAAACSKGLSRGVWRPQVSIT